MINVKHEGANVLSLFDGCSGAYLALEKAGIKIKNYYSSEIDESAIAVQSYHYSGNPRFHQIGNVKDIDVIDYLATDLVIFGSPCIELSSVNPKDRSGLKGPNSSLFFEAIRILRELKKYQYYDKKLFFLMENVASMSKENRNQITQELKNIFGESVQLLKIDSALISSTHRRRLYWTNIPNVSTPKPIDIKFKDILVNGYTDKDKGNVLLSSNVTLTNGIFRYYKMNMGNIIFRDEEFANLPTEEKLIQYPSLLKASGHLGKARSTKNEYEFPNGVYRLPSIVEYSRMMTYPDEYINEVPNVSKTEKHKILGLSFNVATVSHILTSFYKEINMSEWDRILKNV
jgi:site-specific DNA-cytosine methylase